MTDRRRWIIASFEDDEEIRFLVVSANTTAEMLEDGVARILCQCEDEEDAQLVADAVNTFTHN